MVGSGDRDDIDLFVVEELAHVLKELDVPLRFRLESSGLDPQNHRIDVTEGNDFGTWKILKLLHVLHATAANANDSDANHVIGGGLCGARERARSDCRCGGLEKITSIKGLHGHFLLEEPGSYSCTAGVSSHLLIFILAIVPVGFEVIAH